MQEIPEEYLKGYEEAFKKEKVSLYGDKTYNWEYGNSSKVVTKKIGVNEIEATYKTTSSNLSGYNFKTPESFLSNLTKKAENSTDLSKYQAGVRVFHKKFGEGTINYVEQEGEDLKVDINFDKVGHKRLMAKFANLEVID